MINRFTAAFMVFFAANVFAYDVWSLPDFGGDFDLPSNSLEAGIFHRFFNPMATDPWNTLFGIGTGANARIRTVYSIKGIHAEGAFTTDGREYSIGPSYAYVPERLPLQGAIGFHFSSEQHYDMTANDFVRKGDLFFQAVAQTKPLFGRLLATMVCGYDNNESKAGIGTGIEVLVWGGASLFGEISPLRIRLSDDTLYPKAPFCFGARLVTTGHQFLFFLGNATGIGTRKFLYGAMDTDLKVGFEIRRLFSFGEE